MMPKIYWDTLDEVARLKMAFECDDFATAIQAKHTANALICNAGLSETYYRERPKLQPLAVSRLMQFLEQETRRAGIHTSGAMV